MKDIYVFTGIIYALVLVLVLMTYQQAANISLLQDEVIELKTSIKVLNKDLLEYAYRDCYKKCKLDFFYIPMLAKSRTDIKGLNECMDICLKRG